MKVGGQCSLNVTLKAQRYMGPAHLPCGNVPTPFPTSFIFQKINTNFLNFSFLFEKIPLLILRPLNLFLTSYPRKFLRCLKTFGTKMQKVSN